MGQRVILGKKRSLSTLGCLFSVLLVHAVCPSPVKGVVQTWAPLGLRGLPKGCDERGFFHALKGPRAETTPYSSSFGTRFQTQVPGLQQAHRASADIGPREVGGIQSPGKVRRVFKAPPPCRHVRGGVGNVTACAGEELPLRAGAGAGRCAARCGARGCCLGGRPGRRQIGAALNLTGKWLWRTRLSVPGQTDGPTDGRTTEAGAGSRARRPEARVGQAQRRPLCRSAE